MLAVSSKPSITVSPENKDLRSLKIFESGVS